MKSVTAFEVDKNGEDVGAVFFDADGDDDLDLIIGNSGNEVRDKNTYGLRLYLNDGKGNFSKSQEALPLTLTNISKIAPQDYDDDGDVATDGADDGH